jgi:SNF2 family DNA or RNA helicase
MENDDDIIFNSLKNHQHEAIEWIESMENRGIHTLHKRRHRNTVEKIGGGILCLGMGLGKTRTILWNVWNKKQKTIVVCSKTVITAWIEELEKIFSIDVLDEMKNIPSIIEDPDTPRILLFHKEYFKNIAISDEKLFDNYDIVLTTYDVVLAAYKELIIDNPDETVILGDDGMHKDKIIARKHKVSITRNLNGVASIMSYFWDTAITDESQKFCNPKTKIFSAVNTIVAKYKWCLTGTPIKNKDTDIWSLLWFVGMDEVNNSKDWKYAHFTELRLKEMIFHRTLEGTDIILPTKTVITHDINLSNKESNIYLYYFFDLWDVFNKMVSNKLEVDMPMILVLLTRLRQICIAPYLMSSQSKKNPPSVPEPTKLIESSRDNIKKLEKVVHNIDKMGFRSTKIVKVIEIVDDTPSDEKIIIFSAFTSALILIHDALCSRYGCSLLIGNINLKAKTEIIRSFKNDPSSKILLCNYACGSEGLNLQVCNTVIMLEPWWNKVVEDQSIARVYRQGQLRPVTVHKIISLGTIEVQLAKMCLQKDSIGKSYLGGGDKCRKTVEGFTFENLKIILSKTFEHCKSIGVDVDSFLQDNENKN